MKYRLTIKLPRDEKGTLHVRTHPDGLELAWSHEKVCFHRHVVTREEFARMRAGHGLRAEDWSISRLDAKEMELRKEGWIAWADWGEFYRVAPRAWKE